MHLVIAIFACVLIWAALSGGGKKFGLAAVIASLFAWPGAWFVGLMIVASLFSLGDEHKAARPVPVTSIAAPAATDTDKALSPIKTISGSRKGEAAITVNSLDAPKPVAAAPVPAAAAPAPAESPAAPAPYDPNFLAFLFASAGGALGGGLAVLFAVFGAQIPARMNRFWMIELHYAGAGWKRHHLPFRTRDEALIMCGQFRQAAYDIDQHRIIRISQWRVQQDSKAAISMLAGQNDARGAFDELRKQVECDAALKSWKVEKEAAKATKSAGDPGGWRSV
jgi:hypothetical protein